MLHNLLYSNIGKSCSDIDIKKRNIVLHRCIGVSSKPYHFVHKFFGFPCFLARKEDVVALCDWEGLSCVEDSEEIKGLACLYCSPPLVLPIALHFKRLSHILAPNVQIGLPVCPATLPVFPISFRFSTEQGWQIVRKFPTKVPRRQENWVVEFPKGERFGNRNGMNGNKTSGKKLL